MAKQAQTGPRKPVPPYLPYKTFMNALASWRVALPSRIDRSLLGSYSGAMQGWLLATLRYFALIDADGHPTGKLQHLVAADGQERQKLLGEFVRQGYPFLFRDGFDLSKGTAAQLDEKFKDTGAQGDTVRRCVGFFMGLAKDAGVPLSPYLKMRRKTTNGRKATARKTKAKVERIVKSPATIETAGTVTPFQVLYELLDPTDMDDAEQQAVWTLLQYLKKKGG